PAPRRRGGRAGVGGADRQPRAGPAGGPLQGPVADGLGPDGGTTPPAPGDGGEHPEPRGTPVVGGARGVGGVHGGGGLSRIAGMGGIWGGIGGRPGGGGAGRRA